MYEVIVSFNLSSSNCQISQDIGNDFHLIRAGGEVGSDLEFLRESVESLICLSTVLKCSDSVAHISTMKLMFLNEDSYVKLTSWEIRNGMSATTSWVTLM